MDTYCKAMNYSIKSYYFLIRNIDNSLNINHLNQVNIMIQNYYNICNNFALRIKPYKYMKQYIKFINIQSHELGKIYYEKYENFNKNKKSIPKIKGFANV